MNTKIDNKIIRKELRKIAKSPLFINGGTKIDFLKYVVNETLAGRNQQINAYGIAVDGLGISENFDPQTDSRIRVLAGRLRKSLTSYYQRDGAAAAVIIDLPKGGYVPVFSHNTRSVPSPDADVSNHDGLRIMVWPLTHAQKGGLAGAVSDYIGEELCARLGLFPELRTIPYPTAEVYRNRGKTHVDAQKDLDARYVITGRVVQEKESFSVFMSLINAETNTQLWSRRFDDILEFGSLSRLQETVITNTTGAIGGIAGVLLNNKNLGEETPESAMALYASVYRQIPTQGLFRQVESVLIKTLKSAPENAMLRAMLTELYLSGFFMGFYDDPKVLARAKDHLALALLADSKNPFACLVEVFFHTLVGRMDYAAFVLETKIRKVPDDTFLATFYGFALFAMGKYEKAFEIIARAEAINPFMTKYIQVLFFQDRLRLGNYDGALESADKFYVPGFFWSPLLRTVALGLLGRKEAAENAAEELLRNRPDFMVNGHVYLRLFVTAEPVLNLFFQGLKAAGVAIAPPKIPLRIPGFHH